MKGCPSWDEVKWFFDPRDIGVLPDVFVPDTSVEDWQAVLDLIEEQGWSALFSEGEIVLPIPSAQVILSRSPDAEQPHLRVWLSSGVEVIFRFYAAEQIDCDIDIREIQGQERLDLLCGFLAAIGRRLRKPVFVDYEGGGGDRPVLGFDVAADRIVLLADQPDL